MSIVISKVGSNNPGEFRIKLTCDNDKWSRFFFWGPRSAIT